MNYTDDDLFLLLDVNNKALGCGKLETSIYEEQFEMIVQNRKSDLVAKYDEIQIVGMGEAKIGFKCRIVSRDADLIVLEKLERLGPDFRRNLRVPVVFNSFLYPLSGKWKGRRDMESIDLSCGGIAFHGNYQLKDSEQFEVVIPVTTNPVILRCKLLRRYELGEGEYFHAAKFVDLCHAEEAIMREAVFRIQLEDRPRGAEA